MLKKAQVGKAKREEELLKNGYPAYTTSVGWLAYSNEKIQNKCKEAMSKGFTRYHRHKENTSI